MDSAVMTAPKFKEFYDGWAKDEGEILKGIREELHATAESGQPPLQERFRVLVDGLMKHIGVYHDYKLRAANEDTPCVAAGLWRTPLEAGFIWLGGWRPAAAIMLAYSLMGMQIENELQSLLEGVDVPSMAALSHQQLTQLNDLQQSLRKSEGELSDRLAVLQTHELVKPDVIAAAKMMMADQNMTKITAKDPPISESHEYEELGTAIDEKLETLRDLLIDADNLRLQTLKGMLEILTPMQAAQYLVAAVELSIAIRRLGILRTQPLNGAQLPGGKNMPGDIHIGAVKGETKLLVELLKSGANPSEADYEGRTPLHLAAAKGHVECINLLVEQGANVNQTADDADGRGGTPLLDALKGGHDRAAKLLIEHGAVASDREVGVELCRAAATGNLDYLRRLVESAKCNPNTRDYDQRTPLHLAAAEGMYPAVHILLRAGADPMAEDRHGFTPLDEAKRSKQTMVVELLEEYINSQESRQMGEDAGPSSSPTEDGPLHDLREPAKGWKRQSEGEQQ